MAAAAAAAASGPSYNDDEDGYFAESKAVAPAATDGDEDDISKAIMGVSNMPWLYDNPKYVKQKRKRNMVGLPVDSRAPVPATDPFVGHDPEMELADPHREESVSEGHRPYHGELYLLSEHRYNVWPRADPADEDDEDDPTDDLLENSRPWLLPPPPKVNESVAVGGWDDAFENLYDHFEEKFKQEFSSTRIHSRDYYVDADLRGNTETSGSARDKAIRKVLNNMGLRRSDIQIRFHNMCLQACSRNIYGRDFDKCQEEIFNRNGSDEIRHEILAQMPRRFGKSTMTAMVVAALAAFVPGIRIAVFSTVLRTSTKLMKDVYRFLCMIPGARERVAASNREELHINPSAVQRAGWGRKKIPVDPSLVSIIYSYPASVSGTRGYTVDVTIIDEAAHIDGDVWRYSIVPALSTEGMVLLALTTAQSVTNFFSILVAKKRKDGTPLFETLVINLVCDACQAAGKQKTCMHRMHMLPKWKPKGRQEFIQRVLEDDEDVFRQEVLGETLEIAGGVFDKAKIKEFQMRPLYRSLRAPTMIFSFMDPSGGGHWSSQVVVSIYFDGVNVVVKRAHTPRGRESTFTIQNTHLGSELYRR